MWWISISSWQIKYSNFKLRFFFFKITHRYTCGNFCALIYLFGAYNLLYKFLWLLSKSCTQFHTIIFYLLWFTNLEPIYKSKLDSATVWKTTEVVCFWFGYYRTEKYYFILIVCLKVSFVNTKMDYMTSNLLTTWKESSLLNSGNVTESWRSNCVEEGWFI